MNDEPKVDTSDAARSELAKLRAEALFLQDKLRLSESRPVAYARVRPYSDVTSHKLSPDEELTAYRAAFGDGELGGEPCVLDFETIRMRGEQYDDLIDFWNRVVQAVTPPRGILPEQLTTWVCERIASLRLSESHPSAIREAVEGEREGDQKEPLAIRAACRERDLCVEIVDRMIENNLSNLMAAWDFDDNLAPNVRGLLGSVATAIRARGEEK